MSKSFMFAAAASAAAVAAATFAVSALSAGGPPPPHGGGGGTVTPMASGNQIVSSGPGVYDQTSAEYSTSWDWAQDSGPYDYYWYIFTVGGTLAKSGHNASGGGGSWSGVANNYYFKEYNNEPIGSGHINVLSVNYCC
jgi:hypothetical protein